MSNCVKCGANLADDARFCPECGSVQPIPQQQPPQGYQSSQGYQPPQYSAPVNQPGYPQQPLQYVQPPFAPQGEMAPALTTKQYLGMFAVGIIPIAGLILYLMWAFGDVTNPNKKSFARGYLLFSLIVAGISLLLTIIFSVAAASCMYGYYY